MTQQLVELVCNEQVIFWLNIAGKLVNLMAIPLFRVLNVSQNKIAGFITAKLKHNVNSCDRKGVKKKSIHTLQENKYKRKQVKSAIHSYWKDA